jgi:hypothetical protein
VSLEACRDLLQMNMKALFVRPIEICFKLLIIKILQLISLSNPFDLLRTFMVCLDDHKKNKKNGGK